MKIGVVMYQTSLSKGQELVAQRMTKEFRKQGVEAYLITSSYHDDKRIISSDILQRSADGYMRDDKDPKIPRIRVDGYISTWPPRRIVFRNFVDTLRKIIDTFGIDVLITHSTLWNGPEETAKFILWKRTMRELGLDERQMAYCHMPHYQPPDPTSYHITERSFRMAWNRLVFPQIFEVANLILVTTPIEEQYMIKMGAKKDQCHLFPGGVDEELYQNHEGTRFEDFRKKYKIPENKKIISYIGTIEERKNPLAAIRVAGSLSDLQEVHFVIAGHGSNQERQVRTELHELRNVSYVGEISEEQKVQLIKGSYLNILMSRMEALGLTQLEFMYGGVPIVTSAAGGQRWLVRNNIDGIHVNGPEDWIGAEKAIRYLIKNQDVWSIMSENARRRAQEFTLEKLTSGLEKKLRSTFSPQ
ncbi:MAG: glycosyltransferase family 4 protein [archaeon]